MTVFKKSGGGVGRFSSATSPSGGGGFTRSSIALYLTGTSQDPPVGARFMRLAVIGAGADGASSSAQGGGGGGGCASTKIIPAASIAYVIGQRSRSAGATTGLTSATFAGGYIQATGGIGVTGGAGSGGDYSFTGGSALANENPGAGAAGPAGNGASVSATGDPVDAPGLTDNGWAFGGGGAGQTDSGVGGGGPGMPGGGTPTTNGSAGRTIFGVVETVNSTTGRTPGGGGGVASGTGGSGGLIVEWFF